MIWGWRLVNGGDGCGAVYDNRLRAGEESFHFRVLSASSDDQQWHRLVGHWRGGVWDAGAPLGLLRPDGYEVPLTAARWTLHTGSPDSGGRPYSTQPPLCTEAGVRLEP